LPELMVFDLDDCLWSPEMFTLDEMPSGVVRGSLNGRGEGVVGVKSGSETIRLFPGALRVLQECADGEYEPMRLGIASSSDTPLAASIAEASLRLLEVLPGLSLRDLLARGWPEDFEGNVKIGRQKPLSSDKSRTHFPQLRDDTGLPFTSMAFLDDSNWSDHCLMVYQNCPGVVTQRTPNGLQYSEFKTLLDNYDKVHGGARTAPSKEAESTLNNNPAR